MKTCFLIYIAVITVFISSSFCLADEEKKHICFKSIDANKDGRVTFEEFKKIFGKDQQKFDATDLNSDGKLSHDEYHKSLGHGASE